MCLSVTIWSHFSGSVSEIEINKINILSLIQKFKIQEEATKTEGPDKSGGKRQIWQYRERKKTEHDIYTLTTQNYEQCGPL